MVPGAVGSNPIIHPKFKVLRKQGLFLFTGDAAELSWNDC